MISGGGDDFIDGIEAAEYFSEDRIVMIRAMHRLNITMDDDVYARLKKEVPPKKLSAFIAGAVRAKLHPNVKELDAVCQAASKERWRAGIDEDWKHVDGEGWPKWDGYHGVGMSAGSCSTRRLVRRLRTLDRR